MKRAFLYIDILGFEHLVRVKSLKVDEIFYIFDNLKVYNHSSLQTVLFSDTFLVFNKDEGNSTDYYSTFLIEYAQELFYKLSAINIYYKGILTLGEFSFRQLNNIQAYYGLALIDCYKDSENKGVDKLEGFGLYVDRKITNEIVVFDKVPFTEKYDYILLCQSLKNLYSITKGILPIDLDILRDNDTFFRIEEDLRFFREIEYLKENHLCEDVKNKYHKVYNIYKANMPLFFKIFEEQGFLPCIINPEHTGKVNPFELLSKQELNRI